jgi:putative transposon-encoded protein
MGKVIITKRQRSFEAEEILFKEVTLTGNGGHVILPKRLKGRTVVIIVQEGL